MSKTPKPSPKWHTFWGMWSKKEEYSVVCISENILLGPFSYSKWIKISSMFLSSHTHTNIHNTTATKKNLINKWILQRNYNCIFFYQKKCEKKIAGKSILKTKYSFWRTIVLEFGVVNVTINSSKIGKANGVESTLWWNLKKTMLRISKTKYCRSWGSYN